MASLTMSILVAIGVVVAGPGRSGMIVVTVTSATESPMDTATGALTIGSAPEGGEGYAEH